MFGFYVLTCCWVSTTVFGQNVPPQAKCEFDARNTDARVVRIAGGPPVNYYFACQKNRRSADRTGCIKGTRPAGLVVTVNRTDGAWACISGGDSTSGWVQTTDLEQLPSEPKVAFESWQGWWQHPAALRVKGRRNDRLLISTGRMPGSLRVSGRAYWYGKGDVVHFGQLNGESTPMGKYLHIVDGRCILDLSITIEKGAPELQGSDNQACGGLNVNFSGKWVRFTPREAKTSRGS
ncbi:MAG: hypothetical protein JO356_11445 [Acidobacteria bacterium]|nr:hypothetical protein [Acidobacteriota bacterium]